MDREVRVFAGIDWADEEHVVVALNASGKVLAEFKVPHSGVGLRELSDRLIALAGDARAVAVAIEVSYGTIVDTLLERGCGVFSLNPKQLDRFRDRFTVAGAKDDRLDAMVLGSCLRTDMERYQRLEPADEEIVELREWSRMTRELVGERTRLVNQLRAQLWRYYPQVLELKTELYTGWVLALWKLLPTPAKARKVRESTVARLLKKHRVRKYNAKDVVAVLGQPAVHVAPGTTESTVAHIEKLVERLTLVCRQHKESEKKLEQQCQAVRVKEEKSGQHDVEILLSLPGVGRIVLATLLAEAWRPLINRDYHALRSLTGVAPVTKRTGKKAKKKHWKVVMRRARNPHLSEAMYHWGRIASQNDSWARYQYASLRARGHSHGRAIRGLGDRLLSVAHAMLRDGTLYDPSRKQASIARRSMSS